MRITPAPTVLGGLSLTAAVELICAIHLITCVIVISQASSVDVVTVGGIKISPTMQCVSAAWFLLGIPVVIHGGVGAVYRVESHLTAYMMYLLGSLVVVAGWTAAFIKYGNTCATLQPTGTPGSTVTASFVCGISNGMVVFWLLVVIGLVAGSAYLVWSMAEYARKRMETELIRYQEPFQAVQTLADDIAMEQAAGMQAAYMPSKFAPTMQQYGGMQNYGQV